MDKFDVHCHYLFRIPLKRTVEIFENEFRATATKRFNFLSVPLEYSDDGSKQFDPLQNIKGLFLKKAFSPNAHAFAGLMHPEEDRDIDAVAEHFVKQAKRAIAAGFDGFKMIEGYPTFVKYAGVSLDSPVYDRFFSYLEAEKIPVLIHIANPDENWDIQTASKEAIELGRVYDASYPSKEEITDSIFHILKRHPNLRLILAHLGFFSKHYGDASHFLGDYPNTMLDLTPGGEQLLHMRERWDDLWLPFFTTYQGRILYGTDFYAFPDGEDQMVCATRRPNFLTEFLEDTREHDYLGASFRGVGLGETMLRAFYWNNANRYLGTPRAIDDRYFRKEYESLRKRKLTKLDRSDLAYIRKKVSW